MKELLLLLIGSVVMNNCVLQGYLGITTVMGNAKCTCKCVKLGLAVTLTMVLTTLIAWPVQNFVMAPFGLEYFQTLLFVLVILAVVYCLKALVKKDICFPLIVLNSAVLGVTLQNISATFVQALVGALGAGLGLMVAMLLFAGARGKVNDKYVPASLRGLPVDLMTAAILAMAVMAF
ncbi:MAG: electron transport complex subunit RsxA [Ruminococcaceae bacterium]|nr:electron transport complex subunit RsxA [Oscillospiraceae bacterium]